MHVLPIAEGCSVCVTSGDSIYIASHALIEKDSCTVLLSLSLSVSVSVSLSLSRARNSSCGNSIKKMSPDSTLGGVIIVVIEKINVHSGCVPWRVRRDGNRCTNFRNEKKLGGGAARFSSIRLYERGRRTEGEFVLISVE